MFVETIANRLIRAPHAAQWVRSPGMRTAYVAEVFLQSGRIFFVTRRAPLYMLYVFSFRKDSFI